MLSSGPLAINLAVKSPLHWLPVLLAFGQVSPSRTGVADPKTPQAGCTPNPAARPTLVRLEMRTCDAYIDVLIDVLKV